MDSKRTTLASALAIAMGTYAHSTFASLTNSATLNFTLGTTTDPDCPLCPHAITDIYGSYFVMDTNGNGVENNEKTPIGSFNGIHIGTAQAAVGSHSGGINGTESPNVDRPWTFFGGTGMHQTTSPVTADAAAGTIDLSGWNVTWNGIPGIPLTQIGNSTIACSTASCSDTSTYTVDGAFHVNGAGFTTVAYTLHLEGHVSASAIPLPAAAWLFGSGLTGLIGIARRKKA